MDTTNEETYRQTLYDEVEAAFTREPRPACEWFHQVRNAARAYGHAAAQKITGLRHGCACVHIDRVAAEFTLALKSLSSRIPYEARLRLAKDAQNTFIGQVAVLTETPVRIPP